MIPQKEIYEYAGLCDDFVPGVEIRIGWHTFLMPPLAMIDAEKACAGALNGGGLSPMQELKAMLDSGFYTEHGVQTLMSFTLKALARNYPTLTAEYVAKYLDYGNAKDTIEAIFAVNGLGARPTNGAAAASPTPAATVADMSFTATQS